MGPRLGRLCWRPVSTIEPICRPCRASHIAKYQPCRRQFSSALIRPMQDQKPLSQVAYALLEGRHTDMEKPKMHIVWASRKRADCEGGVDISNPYAWEARKTGRIVQELETLQQKYPGQLSVEYLVDEEGKFLDQKKISSLTKASSEVKFGASHTRIDSKLLFVSGPEGFINYIAGPKRWEGGKEGQGQLGGILGQMGIRTWKVWKL